jgi:hypothetical protein
MAQGISRRKYGGITKYLTAVMQDAKASQRVRMNAAMRLSDIYLASDARAAKLEDREYRMALRAQGEHVPEPVETERPAPTLETAREAARAFLAKHRASASADQTQADGGNDDE